MSVRLLTIRFIKHGRYFLQNYCRRDIHTNILEDNQTRTRLRFSAPASSSNVQKLEKTAHVARNVLGGGASNIVGSNAQNVARSGIFRFGKHARKIFIDNILNRVTTIYSQELRQKATKKLFYGDSAPFFALVGVSLASGAGVLTKEDELEGVCWEIREAASRLQLSWSSNILEPVDKQINMDKLDIGPPIAKGCAAVVYAAALKNNFQQQPTVDVSNRHEPQINVQVHSLRRSIRPELMSPMQHMSRFVHNFGGSMDNINVYNQTLLAAACAKEISERQPEKIQLVQPRVLQTANSEEIEIGDSGESNQTKLSTFDVVTNNENIQRYPLALKMMFNYDIQSNAMCILRAMYKETVPARQRFCFQDNIEEETAWERLLQNTTVDLPPHPNIVLMYGYFCEEVRALPEGKLLYPIAQPPRINPDGYGRNMSLYLLMKRYDYSLRALLDKDMLAIRTRVLLFTQLLEAVAHLGRHGVAHRDLKSDNILIEIMDDDSTPLLVLSDFGCCLADRTYGLQLPYSSMDVDKGGNAALMAPEIINKQPGPFNVLNYSKSDLWACGAIAYEIFGNQNPFYAPTRSSKQAKLRNCDYKEDELPALDEECPALVQQLIFNILNPNPSKRISPDIAANIMQLYLWAPSMWLRSGGSDKPNSPEILQWLLSLTSKVMCEERTELSSNSFAQKGRRTYVEYLLLCSFLSRVCLRRVRRALNWIHNVL